MRPEYGFLSLFSDFYSLICFIMISCLKQQLKALEIQTDLVRMSLCLSSCLSHVHEKLSNNMYIIRLKITIFILNGNLENMFESKLSMKLGKVILKCRPVFEDHQNILAAHDLFKSAAILNFSKKLVWQMSR